MNAECGVKCAVASEEALLVKTATLSEDAN